MLLVTADRVDLLRRAPHQDEATEISSVWLNKGHVKALNPLFLLKAPQNWIDWLKT